MSWGWSLSASVLIGAVVLLRGLLRGRISARLQYALWGLVLLRLLLPFSIGHTPFSVENAASPGERALGQAGEALPGFGETAASPGLSQGGQQTQHSQSLFPLPGETGQTPAAPITPAAPAEGRTAVDWQAVLRAAWLLGAIVVGTVLLWSNLRFARLLRRQRTLLSGADCRLPVYVTHGVETPCLFGLFRPAVYLPPAAAEDPAVLRHALAHEETHFRHGDHIWSALRCLCLALHWFHPLVWLAVLLSRQDGELACDEGTIRRLGEGERLAYGRTLIDLTSATSPVSGMFRAATTMADSARQIRARIRRIAQRPRVLWAAVIAAVLLAAVAVACTFTGGKVGSGEQDDAPPVSSEDDAGFVGSEQGIPAEDMEIACFLEQDVPDAVLRYGEDVVRREINYWNVEIPADPLATAEMCNPIIEARITGLTLVETGTAGALEGLSLYRLEYRLLPERQDNILLVGGQSTVELEGKQWRTEQGSTGQPYLLLRWETHQLGETTWERIGLLWELTIQEDYGSPEMLEQYGNVYTAAVMEVYRQWLGDREQPDVPAAALDSLYGEGDSVSVTLYLAEIGQWETLTLPRTAYPSYKTNMETLRMALNLPGWQAVEMPPPDPSDYWLTFVSEDGLRQMTAWCGENTCVEYFDGSSSRYWRRAVSDLRQQLAYLGEIQYEDAEELSLLSIYDLLESDTARIAFAVDGDPEDAMDAFLNEVYLDFLRDLEPYHPYASTLGDYSLPRWELHATLDRPFTDTYISGSFECQFTPAHPDSGELWAGNTASLPEDHSKVKFSRWVGLELQEDGLWHCVDFGTGP